MWRTDGEGWTDEDTPRRYVRVVDAERIDDPNGYEVARVFVDEGDVEMESNLRAILSSGDFDISSGGTFESLHNKVVSWGLERALVSCKPTGEFQPSNGMARAQLLKCMSELGELADATLKQDMAGMRDGLGDTVVTLIMYSVNAGLGFVQSLGEAYKEISSRRGKTVGGTFIRDRSDGQGRER